LVKKYCPPSFLRQAEFRVIPERREPGLELVARGQRRQEPKRQPVLRFDPRLRGGAVEIFQPSVGIGHGGPVVVIRHGSARGGGIFDRAGGERGGGQQGECERQRWTHGAVDPPRLAEASSSLAARRFPVSVGP
jgi:hypothetical protein